MVTRIEGKEKNGAMIKSGTFPVAVGYTGPVVVTGVGFQPDVVIVRSGRLVGAGNVEGFCAGQFDAADKRASYASADKVLGSGAMASGSRWSLFIYEDSSGAKVSSTLTSMDADGFTLNIAFNNGMTTIEDFHFIAMKSA